MKVTRIDIEAAKGKATVRRREDEVVIEVVVGRKTSIWRFFSRIPAGRPAGRHEDQVAMARRLQRTLDGYQGTAGDVAEYARVLATFID